MSNGVPTFHKKEDRSPPLFRYSDRVRPSPIVEPERLRLDGVLCRFSTNDHDRHRRRRNGWAVVFIDGDRPIAAFGDWSKSLTETTIIGDEKNFTPSERERQRIAVEQAKASRAAEIRKRQADAAREANRQWETANPPSAHHPYLERKGIEARGLRERSGFLLVPLRDSNGKIHNVQRIRTDGQKRFLRGGRVSGLYASIGAVTDHVLICEGWATGKTLHEHTCLPVAVAFSAGNLLAVAQALRSKYPSVRITVCADNDAKPDGTNPGVLAATSAASAVSGFLAIPPASGDFNDLYAAGSGNSEIFEASTSDRPTTQ